MDKPTKLSQTMISIATTFCDKIIAWKILSKSNEQSILCFSYFLTQTLPSTLKRIVSIEENVALC